MSLLPRTPPAGNLADGQTGKGTEPAQLKEQSIRAVRPEVLEGRTSHAPETRRRQDARRASDANSSLLALLQITDSAFPSGAFAHSYGLEQLARERRITSPAQAESFVTAVLRGSLATAEAPAAYGAALSANDGDLQAVLAMDKALYRTRAASELRAASVQTGRRLLEETAAHCDDVVLRRFLEQVRAEASPGTHAAAFGVVCAALGVQPDDVPGALMLGAVTSILQASMRLLPVSHRDVQGALHRLRPLIASLALDVVRGHPAPLLSFQPLQEIASMRHSRAAARLFAS